MDKTEPVQFSDSKKMKAEHRAYTYSSRKYDRTKTAKRPKLDATCVEKKDECKSNS